MTLEHENDPRKRFVPNVLPWLIALAALGLYFATLNHWVSLDNAWSTQRLTGWNWQPEARVAAPDLQAAAKAKLDIPSNWRPEERVGALYWLATYPLHWLPAKSVPLALNVLSLVCGALVLMLLARSVALLPHDRTEAQRSREEGAFAMLTIRSAWLPPVLAALVCGLQLTFWESTTSGSAEMLNLLVFAYVVRCVLEFRIDDQQKWLSRAAVVYGLGMANDWVMIAFLPVFVIAVLWIKGIGFFNPGFLKRMLLWGLAGFALFLLMPVVQASANVGHESFWRGLGSQITGNIDSLRMILNRQTLSLQNPSLWVIGVICLLPLLVMGISWPAYFGDPSPLGVAIARFVLHIFHGFLLGVCLWLMLDPEFSPRHNVMLSRSGAPGLTIYYLAVLGIGYLSGYFLLVFGAKPRRPQQVFPLARLLNWLVLLAVWTAATIEPATLVYRNLDQVRLTNGPMLKDYANMLLDGLPAKGAVVLGDYSSNFDRVPKLLLARSAAIDAGRSQDYMFLETSALPFPEYHRLLQKRYSGRWLETFAIKSAHSIQDSALRWLMTSLAQSNTICYVNPSFGYYFESFYAEPHGLAYTLIPFSTNSVIEPLPSEALRAENEAFWNKIAGEQLPPLEAALASSNSTPSIALLERVVHQARLKKEMNPTAVELGRFYSRAVNYWGVQQQRGGALQEAGVQFERALRLVPDSIVAKVNRENNEKLISGKTFSPGPLEPKLGPLGNLQLVISLFGPYDDPDACDALGRLCLVAKNYHQCIREWARVKMFLPTDVMARVRLAQMDLVFQQPDQALKEIAEIRSRPEVFQLSRTNEPALLSTELSAHLGRRELSEAESSLRASLRAYPDEPALLATASQLFFSYGYYTNALPLLEKRVLVDSTNLTVRLQLAQAALLVGLPERALKEIAEVRSRPGVFRLSRTNEPALLSIEVSANLTRKDVEGAQKAVQASLQTYPKDSGLLATTSQVYMRHGYYTNAIPLLDMQLQEAPDDLLSLLTKGLAYVRAKNFEPALVPLTHVLQLQSTNFYAKLARAEAYVGMNQLDAAQKDYEADNEILKELQRKGDSSAATRQLGLVVNRGLGEVAYLKKDSESAIKYYDLYLRDAPTNNPAMSEEIESVRARLKKLQTHTP